MRSHQLSRSAQALRFAALILLSQAAILAGNFRVGVARADITPDLPVWLSGYAARTHPADQIMQHLFAKAMLIDDGHGGRLVVVTTDLLGLPPELANEVADRCLHLYGLKREQLWLNSSHTHSGPVVWPNLRVIFDLNPADEARAAAYAQRLKDQLVAVIGEAIAHPFPARLSYGSGEAGFAANRRIDGLRQLHPGQEFPAPVDHAVPVIQVKDLGGTVRAILFGYACHNTTLTGEFYAVNGDYAGYAQETVEKMHPQAQAMFVVLCAGDQNPSPRSTLPLAISHGNELAASVEQVLSSSLTPLRGPLRNVFQTVAIPFAEHTRQTFEEEARSTNVYHQRRAKLMLAAYNAGSPPRAVGDYPVQAIRFGKTLTIVTLGGEVVVDYAVRAKREFPAANLVVAGYSNGVMSYIPSERILHEGGYEAVDSMMFYAQPGPYAAGVEERIFECIRAALGQLGVRR